MVNHEELIASRTRSLLADGSGLRELERFEKIRDRRLALPRDRVESWLRGRRVVVTGGTGCIGSHLAALVRQHGAAEIVLVSRGVTGPPAAVADLAHRPADVRDPNAMRTVLRAVRPDIVFHCAALRSPAEAQTDVDRCVQTNVLGPLNVLDAARGADVQSLVHASTGKAVRLHATGRYAASKKIGEWLLADAAARYTDLSVSLTRFTHVVDNSIILSRLAAWCSGPAMRLHDPSIAFYGQSAGEAAQLMLAAGLQAMPGLLVTTAIRDLDWPLELLALAVGMQVRRRVSVPIESVGYDAGYDEAALPMLYDPLVAGEVSPLLNLLEARRVRVSPEFPEVDTLIGTPSPPPRSRLVAEITRARRAGWYPSDPGRLLVDLSEHVLDDTLRGAEPAQLRRMLALAEPFTGALGSRDRQIIRRIRYWADRADTRGTPDSPAALLRTAAPVGLPA